MSNHLLDRTSPKGQAFVGRCRYCGRSGLSLIAALNKCPKAPDENQPVLDALEPPRESS